MWFWPQSLRCTRSSSFAKVCNDKRANRGGLNCYVGALVSYQVGSACYPAAVDAARASASANIGSVVQHGTTSFVVDVSTVTGAAITYSFTPLDGSAALSVTTPYTAQPCGLLGVSEGLEMGWLVAACWVGVYAVLFLTRALRGETGSDYGNT